MTKLRNLAAVDAALLAFTAGQSPASAHTVRHRHGNDFAIVHADHKSGAVCDEERDGHNVYAVFSSGAGWTRTVYSGPSNRNCGNANFPSRASAFKVCEEGKGCTRPKRVT